MNTQRWMARCGLTPRQAAAWTVLGDAREPLSTTEVRERVNRGRDHALVAEQVYRALVSLQQAGAVRRVNVVGSRNAFWEAALDLAHEDAG